MNQKISMDDTMQEIVLKLSKDSADCYNPGAIKVVTDIIHKIPDIDPDDFGLGPILWMDQYDIRGCKIWWLYKILCKQDIRKTIGTLRACQLGIISFDMLKNAITSGGRIYDDRLLDVDKLMIEVENRLPNFKRG